MAGPISTLRSVCSDCGVSYDREVTGSRCPECAPPRTVTVARALNDRSKRRRRLGYDAAWDRLSEQARRIQPFCSDCGRTDNLTGDHTPEAWARKAAGKVIRLQDIDVVCRSCNADRGPARGEGAVSRPSIGSRVRELESMAEDMDDLVPDDLDQRVAQGEWGA